MLPEVPDGRRGASRLCAGRLAIYVYMYIYIYIEREREYDSKSYRLVVGVAMVIYSNHPRKCSNHNSNHMQLP